jgi:type VI secretion system secreted protein Hcp
MAVDMFLQLEGIQGESKDKTHADKIQVLSWSWDVAQTGTAGSGTGLTAGKVEHHDIVINKLVDKSSPNLYSYCCKGKHIPTAKLIIRKAGDNPLEYVVIHFTDLVITSFNLGGRPQADQIEEVVKLNYAKVQFDYTPQKNDGGADGTVTGIWNLQTNSDT